MRTLIKLLSSLALSGCGMTASGQTVTLTGSFTGTTLDAGWSVGGSGYTPTLTAPSIDTAGNGWLRLTSAGNNQATYALNTNSFVSKNATITASFNYVSYGGNGADGITFFLADASATFGVGAYGGSLGYAQKTAAGGATNISGMNGGYIGLGIDEFGNYANNSEGRIDGFDTNSAAMTPDAVSIRGPGQGLTGYEYLGGTDTLPASLDTPGSSRPTVTTFQVIITATNQLTVYMDPGATGNLTALYSIDLSGYARPDSLVMGFTGSTGDSTNIHEVQAVALSSVVANLWTNANANSQWGTANDWYGSPSGAVPSNYADVLLDNSYVNSAQAIDVGSNRLIRSLQVDAPFAYTLNNGTLTFDRGGIAGPSGIFVSQTHGSATQTINSALALNNAIQIQNNSAGALNLTGAIATNAKAITVNGSGDVTATGVISGTGSLVKEKAGNLTLNGNNTYSGGTSISGGVITAGHNNALGTGGVIMTGGALAGSGSPTLGNTVSLQGDGGIANLTLSNKLTQSGGNRILELNGATLGAVDLSNNVTSRTLTTNVSGDSTISGVIASGGGSTNGGLTKTGAGVLTLSGANTYEGATTISEGTIKLGAGDRLNDATDVTIGSSGTLNLNGFSERIDNLTAASGATLDFGSASGANTFLFNTYNAPASGVLVVNNWQDGLDNLATTVNGQTVSSIYISGYGIATYNGTATLYGGVRYLLRPVSPTEKEWDGSVNANWNNGEDNNWTTPNDPSSGQIALFDDLGVGRPNVSLGNNEEVAGIRFGSGASVSYNITGAFRVTLSGTVPYVQQQSSHDQTLAFNELRLNGNTVADITGSGNLLINSTITETGGTRSLIKDGVGTGKLILGGTGTNTYTGGLFINNGTVEARKSSALGTGAATIASGATLELSGGITPTNAITLGGAGVGGNGAIRNLSGNNELSGDLTLSNDTRFQSDSGMLTLSGAALNDAGRDLAFGGAGNITVTKGIATGTGTVAKDGGGTLTYSGATANTYTGDTTVDGGTLALSKNSGVVSIAGNLVVNAGSVNQTANGQFATSSGITLNGGTYNLDGSGTVTQTVRSLDTASGSTVSLGANDALTISGSGVSTVNGVISGAGSLITDGTGNVYLGGANTYTGTTTVGSVVTAANSSSLGTGAVTVNSGGNLQVQGGATLANNFTITGSGTTANDGAIENFSGSNTISGNIALGGNARIQSSSGTLTLGSGGTLTAPNTNKNLTIGGGGDTVINRNINTGTGTLTKDGTGTLTLGAANSYSGATALNAGTTRLNAANVFSDTASLTVATGAILDLNGYSETAGSLQGGGSGAGGSIEFGGATLTLAGASSFGGDFGFSNGTIILNAGVSLTLTDSFNAANINIILNGGSLYLGNGLNQTFGNLTVIGSSDSVIDFGTSGATIAQFENVNVTGSGKLNVNNWTNAVDYFLATNSPGPQGSSPTNKVVFAGYVGGDTKWLPYGGGNGQLTPVPEPSTYGALMLGSAAGLLWLRRRSGKRR